MSDFRSKSDIIEREKCLVNTFLFTAFKFTAYITDIFPYYRDSLSAFFSKNSGYFWLKRNFHTHKGGGVKS